MRFLFPARACSFAPCLFLVLVGSGSPAIGAEPAPATATAKLTCAHASEPGRVRCEVEARVPAGVSLTWADVVVTRTPSFATALRGRVGPLEATAHEDTVWRWAIALAARARGTGELAVRLRLVACVKNACTSSELDARADVVVGE